MASRTSKDTFFIGHSPFVEICGYFRSYSKVIIA
jgi:hypothetical protein